MQSSVTLTVNRSDLTQTKFIEAPLPGPHDLPDNGLLVKVDRFAFTANNITYALLGDQLKYWQLFPAPDGYGVIPVWGFGEVLVSHHEQVAKGERLFGYFPMASHLVIEAGDVRAKTLRDAAAHRQSVSPVYNAYSRVTGDDDFAGNNGDYQALLRPLFMLSFLVDDFLGENHFFGGNIVVLTSASSKVALGLTHLLHTGRKAVRVIGLTSAANLAFVSSLGCYDEVVSYDRIGDLPASEPIVLVDMAGSTSLRERLHDHFADRMKYSCLVGLTHQDGAQHRDDLPGARPVWFFAPDQMRKRAREWGPGGIDNRFNQAWRGFIPFVERHISIAESRGREAVNRIYKDTIGGRVAPEQGQILSLVG